MIQEFVISLGREALVTALMTAAPMLGFGLLAGLVVSILQAVTQIHEMTLTFIPKILAVMFALALFMPWILNNLLRFTVRLFTDFPEFIR